MPPKPHQKSHPIQPLPPNPPLPKRSLTNEAESSSSTSPNVVTAAPHYKEMRIPRHATLQPQEPNSAKTDRTPFVTSFNPALPKISSVVNKYTTLLQATANCKKAFSKPPVIAYRCNASLRDLLVHSTLSHENSSSQQPAGIKKCNHPRCLTCSFLQEGQTNYTFFTTNENRKITDSISCHSKNLIYMIECTKCHLQYIGETKRQLNERFGEHRRSILNHHQLSITTPVSSHFKVSW